MSTLNIKLLIKRLFLILVLFLLILFTNVFRVKGNSETIQQLLYQVDNSSEAYDIAEQYNLEIIKIGYGGIITYEVKDEKIIPQLLEKGFCYNDMRDADFIINPKSDPRQKEQYALTMMQTIDAWNLTSGSEDVLVAVIDTGIDIYHTEFQGRISPLSYNTNENTVGLEAVIDDQGHGTMVAGVIAANKDNSFGISGIAPNVKLLVIKANIPNEEKGFFYDDDIIEAIYYAADNGAKIINMSLGGPGYNSLMNRAVEYAYSKGSIIVAAAGNDANNEKRYPAAYDLTISVSAIDDSKNLATYSNYGSTITVTAPGTDILTTNTNNTFKYVDGTSLSAPQVSGVLALLKSYYHDITVDEMFARITLTAEDIDPAGKDQYFGYGLVNTFNALSEEIHSVTFETFNGSKIKPLYFKNNTKFSLPKEPTLAEHFFDGWYLDQNLTIPFDSQNYYVDHDLILYAKFTKNYHLVTFISSGSRIEPILVKHGEIFELPVSNLEHYDFLYWTIDSSGDIQYSLEPVLDDLTLYAQYSPKIYNIELIIDGQLLEVLEFTILDQVDLPIPDQENQTFVGWFLDPELTVPFDSKTLTSNLKLYAKFKHKPIQVNYYVNLEISKIISVEYNTIPEEYIPTMQGHTFIGWFFEPDYSTQYQNEELNKNTNLYAKFEEKIYLVKFYSYNHTILFEEQLPFGSKIVPPAAPVKPSSLNFEYKFKEWINLPEFISSNLDIYPQYKKQYINSSIILKPGIDTINIGDLWIDGGLENIEEYLNIIKNGEVDSTVVGRYQISYNVFDGLELIDQIIRFVNVVEKETLISISINPGVSTIVAGEKYHDAGAWAEGEKLEIINNVDSNVPGVYQIIYKLSINNKSITKTRYVHVLEKQTYQKPLAVPYLKKKEDLYEI